MDVIDAILTRRSVRDFKADPIKAEEIQILLRAGMQAPSASNERPWQFVVIDDPEVLHAIPEFHPQAKVLMYAPLAILVCSDRKLEVKRASWLQDTSAAMENMLLAAHGLGLGGVWLGVFPDADRVSGMQKLLDLPKDIRPMGLAAFGYPALKPEPVDRYDEARIHKNKW